jgi:hypothetical protein
MAIEKQPFTSYTLEGEQIGAKADIVNIRLNSEERALLDKCKLILRQERDGTALKQLAIIGAANVIHDVSINTFLGFFFKNSNNNARLGVGLDEPNFKQL